LSNNLSEFNKNFSTNLDKLNKVFAGNIQNLDNTLENFVQSYEKLDKLIQRIEDIKIDKLASINQKVYEKLKNASQEIGIFAEFLERSNQYLSNIEELTKKLDKYEERTQIIEKAGEFYNRNEKWLAENYEKATREVKKSIKSFIEGFKESVTQFSEKTEGIYSTLEKTIKDALQVIPDTAKSYSLEILEGTKSTFEEQRKYVNIIIEEQKKHFHSIFENQKQLFDSLAQIPVISKEIENLTPLKNEVIELKEATLIQNQTMKSQNEKMVNLLQDLVKEFASFSEIIDKLPIRNKLPELTSSKLQTIDLPVSESSKSLSASKSEELEILKVPKVHLPLYLKIMMIIAFVMIIIASTFVVWSSLRYLNFI
jgi:tetratricopeptide (TPR) repeat protein